MDRHMVNLADEADDAQLIRGILQGQVDLFEILLSRYRNYVLKIVCGFLPPEAAADYAQDIFVDVYRALPRYDERDAFRSWLAAIATRRCYAYWRDHYRKREIPASALSQEHQDWADKIADLGADEAFKSQEARREAREILQWALAGLSAKDRMVLTLVHLEGFSIEEAAERLGWSTVNVKVRAHRSRRKLRKRIASMREGDI